MRALVILLFCFGLSGAAEAREQAKGFLGAQLQDVTKQEADALGWESPRGAKLVKPVPGGPAEKAGLLPDDILLSLDGVEVENRAGFDATVERQGAGHGNQAPAAARRQGKAARRNARRPAGGASARGAEGRADPAARHRRAYGEDHGARVYAGWQVIVSASDDKVIRMWDLASA